MTTDIVFVGPTLDASEVAEILPCAVRAPAAQGDVLRAVWEGAERIGIVDGYFERVPSVWHKEILYAMSRGVAVYGSASMGALRAAELATFGMVGVGWVFEQYVAGYLQADDEVAVVHGPAESGYRVGSEALVNIRQTLASAQRESVIDKETARAILDAAIRQWFPDRSWGHLLAVPGLPASEVSALRDWLPTGRVDQKAEDARHMLIVMATRGHEPPTPRWELEHTVWWDHLIRHATPAADVDGPSVTLDDLLVEVRLVPGRFVSSFDAAFNTVLARDEADRRGIRPTPESRTRARAQLPGVDGDSSAGRLIDDRAKINLLKSVLAPRVLAEIADHLRVTGCYTELAERACRKREGRDVRHSMADPQTLPDDSTVLSWFRGRIGQTISDMSHAAGVLGFSEEADARRCLVDEYLFMQQQGTRDEHGSDRIGG